MTPQGYTLGDKLKALTPHIWVTPTVVACCVAFFVYMVTQGVSVLSPSAQQIIDFGGNVAITTSRGDWWRLFSAMFLHIGIIHLAFNMWVLWDVGRHVERMLGSTGFVLTYVTAGLVGGFASSFAHPDVVSAGASGAVFGVFGALVGFWLRQRPSLTGAELKKASKGVGMLIVYNVIFGFSVEGIDNAAHLGGLVGGFVCGVLQSAPLHPASRGTRWKRNIPVAIILCGLVLWAVFGFKNLGVDYAKEMAVHAALEKSVLAKVDAVDNRTFENSPQALAVDFTNNVIRPWQQEIRRLESMHPAKRLQPTHKAIIDYSRLELKLFETIRDAAASGKSWEQLQGEISHLNSLFDAAQTKLDSL